MGEDMHGRHARGLTGIVLAIALGACSPRAAADRLADAADHEGSLVVWSAIDKDKARSLIDDFSARHPAIHVVYRELLARQLNDEFLAVVAHGAAPADLVWSSAMDLQIKLVNDGYAQRYVSPERDNLPGWANWKDQAWGTTAEPIIMVYNNRLIADAAVPRTHQALTRMLEAAGPARRGLIATSDPVASAVGYLYLAQDAEASHDLWRMVRAMGARGVLRRGSAEEVLQDVIAERAAIGYNIVGSYALGEAERHPELRLVIPRDYTLLMSRIAIIPAAARHPSAAKLFLDFVLSRQGQRHLADNNMPSVRADVSGPPTLQAPGVPLRAIRVGPALLVDQDRLTRQYFIKRWNAALGPVQAADNVVGGRCGIGPPASTTAC